MCQNIQRKSKAINNTVRKNSYLKVLVERKEKEGTQKAKHKQNELHKRVNNESVNKVVGCDFPPNHLTE